MPFPAAVLALVLVTLIWGTTFAVIKDVLVTTPVSLLLALRFSLAALAFIWVPFDRRALRPALILGLLAFAGFATQTLGLEITTASKAAFITGLNVILAPMVGRLLYGDRVAPRVYLAALLAISGLGLMTLQGSGGVNGGDLWVIGTAVSYAVYIVYLGEVAGRANVLAIAGLQQLPMALLAWLWALPQLSVLPTLPLSSYLAILYLALVATALVTVVQTYAQRVVPAYLAALLFALEPVFAALFAFMLLGETMSAVGWIGGGVVLVAMLVGEIRPRGVASGASDAAPPGDEP
jgi:drug/metabolite transporter (DMT)-like permease